MSERTHWVEVNETHIYLHAVAAEWWAFFRHIVYGRTDRVRTVRAGIVGDTVLVACEDREHASWLREHMLSHGVPHSAATLRSYRAGEEPPAVGLTGADREQVSS